MHLAIWKNACCDLHKYILQFEKPLVSSLTGDRSGKPTYNQIFHPISGRLPPNSMSIELLQKYLLTQLSVSMCQMDIQYVIN